MKHLFFQWQKDIIGLVCLSLGIFLGLSLVSYQSADPSFNSIGSNLNIHNYCGYFGSFTADLLYQWLGLGAWALVLAMAGVGIGLIRNKKEVWNPSYGFWVLIFVLTLSSLASLYWPKALFLGGQVKVGGVIGLFFAEQLQFFLNPIGASVLLWTTLVVITVFLTERSVLEIVSWPWNFSMILWGQLKSSSSGDLKVKSTSISNSIAMKIQNLGQDSEKLSEPPPEEEESSSRDDFVEEIGKTRISDSPQFPLSSVSKELTESLRPFSLVNKERIDEVVSFPLNRTDVRNQTPKIHRDFVRLLKQKTDHGVEKSQIDLKKVNRHVAQWELPNLFLLKDHPPISDGVDEREIQEKSDLLINKLEQFSVHGQITEIRSGPAVTMFEFKPNVDVKISRITDLADDLCLALSSESVRIIAPIPGKNVVGIETSNEDREIVYLKNILESEDFWSSDIKLPMALGCQADGRSKVVDLRKMPHLLIAGSTGSGKSVFTVSILAGLLFRHSPETLRLILVDPKQVDLASFSGIPHLLMPPILETKKAVSALKWAIREMETRYRSMSRFGARDIESFNEKVRGLTEEEIEGHRVQNKENLATCKGQTYYYLPQPYIVIAIEEFGDLMAVDKSNVEQSVVRLAQMARACGMHLILAMQSPRKDVVTGLIKTNIPGRISFKVASKMDSRIILDEGGAERLLSRGDMLFVSPGLSKPIRHHGPWLSDSEILDLANYWREQGKPEFDELAMRALDGSGGGFDWESEEHNGESELDEKYDEILAQVAELEEVSASLLQRKFRLGYPRAARMIEVFEREGVIGPAQGGKARPVLINKI